MRTSGIRLIILTLITCISIPYAQSKISNLSLGKTNYERGNYQKALSCFDQALKQQPDNATILYYRANTLIKLGLRTQALLDYQRAYQLASSVIMRDYCSQAMSALASNAGVSALNNNTQSNMYADERAQLSQSLGAIQLQSAMSKVRIIDTTELFAQDHTMKQQVKLGEMRSETARNLQQMKDATYYDQFGNKKPLYSASDIQSYEDDRKQEEEPIIESIKKNTMGQTQSAQRQALLTEESATNLQSQLLGDGLADGVRLDPLGTNLYVRNYDTSPRTEPLPKLPPELRQTKSSSKLSYTKPVHCSINSRTLKSDRKHNTQK